MTKETDKTRISWFKGVLSNQNQLDKNSPVQEGAVTEIAAEESDQPVINSNIQLFSKDNQDKIASDVIASIENMLKDRQLLSYKNIGLEDQLYSANETINRFKHDLIKKDQLLQEKNKEIRDLENSLTSKQMLYDQLLEDYKEYQAKSNMEYEEISNQLEKETAKYNKLYEESTNVQYQNMLTIQKLEDKIRNLEIENNKYVEQYQKIVNDKKELMQTINDFTERMSFTFSTKTNASNPIESE
ncbi:hypothetical protein KHA93_16210 [Bacillus sp. FJAT-49732]|uniref:Uncharacterized protein n=1 Tax=Lederbergia citrisecunda TaxID=2833583 RepID=A0A942YM79_9BACI|nr:hypothetical protein [Lederbergia citrisecunda]MBS4201184.1 hypothetical protein [Lederbergia citrisecunda]